jgi:hypothetical protein
MKHKNGLFGLKNDPGQYELEDDDDQQVLVNIKLFPSCRELIRKDKITLKLKNQYSRLFEHS